MPTTDSKSFRKAIRRTLVHHAGSSPDARTIAEATLSTWNQMSARLTPVIGTRGADVLFNRSLNLTSATYRWLAITDICDNTDLLAKKTLLELLASRETDDVAEASYTLLVTFTELLAAMIGETLTERLLLPVWVPQAPKSEQEKRS